MNCLQKQLRCWRSDESGTTAVEFALIAMPFFLLVLSIFELALMFATASMLEGATGSASRMLRTGQIQQASADPGAQAAMFQDALCNRINVLIRCEDVQIEVRNIGSFGNFDGFAAQYDGNGNLSSEAFEAGGVNDVVLVRVGYRHQLMIPFVNILLSGNESGSQYFMSTLVMQVEPYEFTGEA